MAGAISAGRAGSTGDSGSLRKRRLASELAVHHRPRRPCCSLRWAKGATVTPLGFDRSGGDYGFRSAPESRVELLEAIAKAARDFVATTSWYRQNKASRDEFE